MTAAVLLALGSGDPGDVPGARLIPGDALLLDRLRAGDERALEMVFVQLADRLAGFARRVGIDPDEAEQVVIDVFHDVWQRRETLRTDVSLEAYFHRAVRNRALDRVRAEGRRNRYETEGAEFWQRSHEGRASDAQEEIEDHAEVIETVRTVIATLPESQRTVLYLRYTRELPIAEVAEVMDISLGAVKMLLQRAIRTLRTRVGGVFERL